MALNASHVTLREEISTGIRSLFYVITPAESSFKDIGEVPEYVEKATPYFFTLIVLESLIHLIRGRKDLAFRSNDAFASNSGGIISLLSLFVARNIEVSSYIYVYDNFQVMSLPWNSWWTWVLCALGTDLGYYWIHRFAHEIFYLPMALFIPPPIFMVHLQFNLLYQFWIHTNVVGKLGPLEWVLNTASHHRVHHGRNRYCIDKNYGGLLIIWDRMFGTFAEERDNEPIAYGTVHPVNSWDPIYIQFCHWKHILKTAWRMDGLQNKINVFVRGPGWEPGKPRLGNIEDIPNIKAPQPKYMKNIPLLMNIYAWVHFGIALAYFEYTGRHKEDMDTAHLVSSIAFIVWTLVSIGFIYEHKWYANLMELLRCITWIAFDYYHCGFNSCHTLMMVPRIIFCASVGICLLKLFRNNPGKKED